MFSDNKIRNQYEKTPQNWETNTLQNNPRDKKEIKRK